MSPFFYPVYTASAPGLVNVSHLRPRRVTERIQAGALGYGSFVTVLVGHEEARQAVVLAGPSFVGGLWFLGTALGGGPFPEGSTLVVGMGNVLEISS